MRLVLKAKAKPMWSRSTHGGKPVMKTPKGWVPISQGMRMREQSQSGVKTAKDAQPKTEKKSETTDGVWIGTPNGILHVPEKYVHKRFEAKGHKFVVHNSLKEGTPDSYDSLSDEFFTVTEVTSGMGAGKGNSVDAAMANFVTKTQGFTKESLSELVSNSIKKIGGVDTREESTNELREPPPPITKGKLNEAAMKLINAPEFTLYNVFDDSDMVDRVVEWMEEFLSDDDIRNLQENIIEQYNQATIEIAIQGVGEGEHGYSMDLDDADNVDTACSIMVGAVSDYGAQDITYWEVAEWADKVGIDLTCGNSIADYAYYGEFVEKSNSEILWEAYENDIHPDLAVEWAESEEQDMLSEEGYGEGEGEPVEGDVEIAGSTWDDPSLTYLGRWVSGGVGGVRTAIVMNDMKDFPEELKEKFGNTFFGLYTSDVTHNQEYMESLLERVTDTGENILYRGTRNALWEKAEVGEAVPIGLASFSKSESVARGFGTTIIELIPPPPLKGLPIDDINEEEPDIARHYGVMGHPHEQEVAVRAPFMQILHRTKSATGSTVVRARIIEDPKEVLEMRKAQNELGGDNPPIVIRDDPKFYASLFTDMSTPLSDRSKKKKGKKTKLVVRKKKKK